MNSFSMCVILKATLVVLFVKEKNILVLKSDKLLNIISESLPDLSNKKIKSFIKMHMVEVDGKVETNSSKIIPEGGRVRVIFNERIIPEYDIDIIYEDKDIIVINKPAGLLSISNRKEKELTAFRLVSDYIKSKNKNAKLFVVHRLDQATSGVLMFAKSENVKKLFQNSWNEIVTMREYMAIVEGRTKNEETIESYLTMNHFQIVHSTRDKEHGWYSKTHYKTVKSNGKYSFLEVDISTGRRNQIRVHMSEAGHPVIGDKKYIAKHNPIGRLGLHASRLELIDPRNKKKLSFVAPMPEEMEAFVKQIH